MDLISQIRYKAGLKDATIVLPESTDPRVIKAASFLVGEGICKVMLVGNREESEKIAKKENISINEEVSFVNYDTFPQAEELAERLYERRKHKGLTLEATAPLLRENAVFFAASLLANDHVNGCVAGSVFTTGDVLRAAIQVIGLKPESKIVSSVFLLHTHDERVLTYGDCAVVPYPDASQLANIALDSAQTHESLTGETPRVALLSFSTKGSAEHESISKVREAYKIAKEANPELAIDGELQFDAAYLPNVGASKAPGSDVAGRANVYVFPNIDAGNIGYKITERLAGAVAIGPIIQGLAKPMNDLSRGCDWEDIVNTVCVTILQAD